MLPPEATMGEDHVSCTHKGVKGCVHPLPRRQALLRLPFPVPETHEARGRLVAPMARPMLPRPMLLSLSLSSRPWGRGHWQALSLMHRHGPALEARDGMDADASVIVKLA